MDPFEKLAMVIKLEHEIVEHYVRCLDKESGDQWGGLNTVKETRIPLKEDVSQHIQVA